MRHHLTAGLIISALTLTACTPAADTSSDSSKSSPAKPPAFKVVQQDTSGNQREVVVEVDTMKDLKGVFGAVTKTLKDDAGYFISINCSTGGTASVDNRLANGKLALGTMGAATTGLDEGDTEFSANKGRSCPDKG